jgi:hypothetical protein
MRFMRSKVIPVPAKGPRLRMTESTVKYRSLRDFTIASNNLHVESMSKKSALSGRLSVALAAGLAILSVAAVAASSRFTPKRAPAGLAAAAAALFSSTAWTPTAMGSIDPSVFKLALGAASCAVRAGDVENPSTLTVIDYSKPSTDKRLWVYDLPSRRLLFQEAVAHGQGSGDNTPTRFSNEDDTRRSSLGLFVTRDTYSGKNGYSLRLAGLDVGFNDHALARAIVMHGAQYVSDAFARVHGRLGRSWGCPALREGIVHAVIDRIKGGSLMFAYYPDPAWLKASKFLGDCAAARP